MTSSEKKSDFIRAYLAAGFPVIPLRGKKPFEIDWEKKPLGFHNEKTIGDLNYGVCLTDADLVLDVDPRHFEKNDNPLQRLDARFNLQALKTYIVATGGGGWHIHLKKPPEFRVLFGHKEYPGIQIKAGVGHQIVGPGSIHPDTKKEYKVCSGSLDKIANAPEGLLKFLERKAAETRNSAGTEAYQDEVSNIERFAAWLKTSAPTSGSYKIACRGRDFGLSPEKTLNAMMAYWNLRRVIPRTTDEMSTRVDHAYKYAKGTLGNAHPAAYFEEIKNQPPLLKKSKGGQKAKSLANLVNLLEQEKMGLKGCFGYNDFSRCAEIIKETPWGSAVGSSASDLDLIMLRALLSTTQNYEASKSDIADAVISVSRRYRFHPIKKYLEALRWDGTPRLDQWLILYCGAKDDPEGYVRAASRKTLCAAVARIYNPGCKSDHVLVLEGTQGLGKSGVCEILASTPWFGGFKMDLWKNADTIQMMQGHWIIEIADMHVARQTDLETLKSFLTRTIDQARFAYERLPAKYPRQSIFIATYNPGSAGTYLKDDENRRWWPVECQAVKGKHFDFEGLKNARDQIWAEALVKYKNGECLKMDTPELQDASLKAQTARRIEAPWTERIREWIAERDKDETTRSDFYTGREFWIGAMCGNDSHFTRREQLDIARAVRDLGWEYGVKRVKDSLLKGYRRKSSTYIDENKSQQNGTTQTKTLDKIFTEW